jgi:hypothetical protein
MKLNNVYDSLWSVETELPGYPSYVAPVGDVGYSIEELVSYVDFIKYENGGNVNITAVGEEEQLGEWGIPGEIWFYAEQ